MTGAEYSGGGVERQSVRRVRSPVLIQGAAMTQTRARPTASTQRQEGAFLGEPPRRPDKAIDGSR